MEYLDVWFVPKEPVASIAGGFLDNTEIGKPGDEVIGGGISCASELPHIGDA